VTETLAVFKTPKEQEMMESREVQQASQPKPYSQVRGGSMKKASFLTLLIAVFALLLSACDTGGSPKTGAVEAVKIVSKPGSLELGKSMKLTVSVEGSNVSQEVMWTSSDTSVATVDAGNITALKAGSSMITATSKANPSKADSFTLLVVTVATTPPPLVIDSIELVHTGTFTEYGSLQIRQDYGGIILVARGTGLEKGANPRLIGPDGRTIPGVILQDLSNNTSVFALMNISKGVSVGQQTLRFDVNDFGPVEKANAVQITPIVFSPTGNDTTGLGTFDKPFKTFEGASYMVDDGDTMFLTNGQHLRSVTYNLPNGVTLEGESMDGAILQANGGMGGSDAILFDAKGTVKTLSIRGFDEGIYLDVTDDAILTEVKFLNSTDSGLELNDTSKAVVTDCLFIENDDSGVDVFDDAELTMVGGEFRNNADAGLDISSGDAKVSLDGVSILGSGDEGLEWSGDVNSSLKVRNTTITGSKHNGVQVFGLGELDFGKAGDLGNNNIRDNRVDGAATYWEVYDDRPARAVADGQIFYLVGTKLQNRDDLGGPTGLVTGVISYGAGINYYNIVNANNRMQLR
jgi:Bacterial Ig-like domain (group 2)/Right handed beta helix region